MWRLSSLALHFHHIFMWHHVIVRFHLVLSRVCYWHLFIVSMVSFFFNSKQFIFVYRVIFINLSCLSSSRYMYEAIFVIISRDALIVLYHRHHQHHHWLHYRARGTQKSVPECHDAEQYDAKDLLFFFSISSSCSHTN